MVNQPDSYASFRFLLLRYHVLYNSNKFMLNIQEVVVYFALFLIALSFLRILVNYSIIFVTKPLERLKEDYFLKEYGYTYEIVFVFKVLDDTDKEQLTNYQKKFSMKHVIDRFQNALLETKCFYSIQRDEIYVKVRAKHERLLKEAARIDYKLQLDPAKLKLKVIAGKKDPSSARSHRKLINDGYKWKPIIIEDEYDQSSINPYKYIYAPYRESEELQSIYKTRPTKSGNELLLTQTDRYFVYLS